jgi:ABC-type Fe3+-hydroxamate transport system substrate-binding protein
MLAIIISVIALLIIGTVIYLYKSGKIEDKDGNFIPDVIEEKVEEVKQRAARVADEVKDVAAAAKEVVKQSKDVVNAAKGNTTRKGRRPKAKSKPTE